MINKTNELQQSGSRLSVCRQNKNMTQEELANKLGVTPQALSKWERGVSLPDTAMLPDIAHMLEISTDYLLEISQENTTQKINNEIQNIIGENTLHYVIEKLGDCIGEKYFEIINPDILKGLVENLRMKYPVLIEGIVPDKISYHLLTDMVKRVMRKGGSIIYLPKIIEIMTHVLEWQENVSVQELEDKILAEIKREDNFSCVLEKRKA